MGGDFNVIWDELEKFGGLPVSLNEVNDFRHCVNTCNLTDLGFKAAYILGGMDMLEMIVFSRDWIGALPILNYNRCGQE